MFIKLIFLYPVKQRIFSDTDSKRFTAQTVKKYNA